MTLRQDVNQIYTTTLSKLQPTEIVKNEINLRNQYFSAFKKIYPIAFGKAAIPMIDGVISLKNIYKKPIVVTNDTTKHTTIDANLYFSSHPTPDTNSISGAKAVINYIKDSNKNDLVLFLISGGGSSLLSLPPNDIPLKDKIYLTELLLKSGCNINELNTVRKHISLIKGGRLSKIAHPSKVLSLIISDVVNNDVSSIASGPTASDITTFSDALKIIEKYNLTSKTPQSIKKYLEQGSFGQIEESPDILHNTENSIICSNNIFKEELKQNAMNLGYTTFIVKEDYTGEAKMEAKKLIKYVNNKIKTQTEKKIAIISGGETVVKIKGTGKGGRNQEFSLAFLSEYKQISSNTDWLLLSVGTDGIDGPTDAAGGIIDSSSIKKYISNNLNINTYLDNNDSYTFLDQIDSLYKTGPTGTNVADVQIILLDNSR
tara:strand:+ start:577 stop:1866 length:1290 start_codon:yes stop_codon:yes gene_type:complete